MFGLGELGDVERGVAEGDELLALGQFDGIEEWLVPGHKLLPNPSIAFWEMRVFRQDAYAQS